jgi:hypothetical protein
MMLSVTALFKKLLMVKVANKNAIEKVSCLLPFTGSNIYGEWNSNLLSPEDEVYVVYSYGEHFPMFIYSSLTRQWYENEDGYSMTTRRHKTQLRPASKTRVISHSCMVCIARSGIKALLRHRITRGLLC